ncbi:MAG: histidine--tRNA ligase [Bacteroidetes bacterium]|nr:histidine--tRNA ligase [Bacteroidota bacterium]
MAVNTTIPKGTRDFSPIEMLRRNYIFDIIRKVFQKYGFMPIETPAMENLTTLLGKYGEEGDRLIFKILNSGDFMSNVNCDDKESVTSTKITNKISEKALRYDLTVPFARYVVQHQNEITFPFKRYQIQPVWRADRPQKGRYREFYQCDVDVIGSNSLLNEIELIQIIDEVFQNLGLAVIIKLNNRKILSGIAEIINESSKIIDITVAIDKFEKIGLEKVNEELLSKGISPEAVKKLQPIILLSGSIEEKISNLKSVLNSSEIGLKGIEEIEKIIDYTKKIELQTCIDFDLTLARGLNYYTGAIFEVKAKDHEIGSICGGGRYDDLTGIFGLKNVSGVGVSFGADRIYDVLLGLNKFNDNIENSTEIMFVNFGDLEIEKLCLSHLVSIRKQGISAELYPESHKMKKQFDYANNKKIPFVAIIGENEKQKGVIMLKNMTTGEQNETSLKELINILTNRK